MPRVDDLRLRLGNHHGAHHRAHPAGDPLAVRGHHAVREDPVPVVDAAGEAPSPAHPVPALDLLGGSLRAEGTADRGIGVVAVQLVEAATREPRQHGGTLDADRRRPREGAIDAGEGLDDVEHLVGGGLQAAVSRRQEQTVHTELAKTVVKVARHPPGGLDLVETLEQPVTELADRIDDGGRADGVLHGHLWFSLWIGVAAHPLWWIRNGTVLFMDLDSKET